MRRLTHTESGQQSWSPNGTKIAFVRVGSGIWTMRADGSHKRELIEGAYAPAWQPK